MNKVKPETIKGVIKSKMKAAIYTRVSTPDQAVNGESLDMQKERLIEYVKNHGWELYKAYEDGGFSGKNVNRLAFQKMMKDAEAKKLGLSSVLCKLHYYFHKITVKNPHFQT